jgi:hypothetical protein
MNDFSLDDLRAVLHTPPNEPVAPDRAAAVRRRARLIRQRRTAVTAIALAVPTVGVGVLGVEADRVGLFGFGSEPASTGAGPAWGEPSKLLGQGSEASPSAGAVGSQSPGGGYWPGSGGVPGQGGKPRHVRTVPPALRTEPGLAVSLVPSASDVKVGEEVTFTLTWSDTDGVYQGYEMSFGDFPASGFESAPCKSDKVQPSSDSWQFSHAWSQPGTYHVYYTITTGDCGAQVETASATAVITVRAPEPEPNASPSSPTAQPSTTPSATPTATRTPS